MTLKRNDQRAVWVLLKLEPHSIFAASLKYFLLAIGFVLTSTVSSQSEENSAGTVKLLERTEDSLKSISSYSSVGKIEVIYSADFLKMMGHPTINNKKTFGYEVLAKEGNMKLKLTEFGPDGSEVSEISHYLTPTTYSRLDSGGFAVVTSDVSGADESNMNDFYGPMTVFSFLVEPVAGYGLRPVTPRTLNDAAAWSALLDSTKTRITNEGLGESLLSFQKQQDRWEVNFSKQSNGVLMPEEIKFYTLQNGKEFLLRHLIVEGYSFVSKGLLLPNQFYLACYEINPTTHASVLGATFHFKGDKTEVGVDIDNAELEFDPSTARRIWDADHKKFVDVPN